MCVRVTHINVCTHICTQEKFTERYEASEAQVTATLRDLPPVAGKILWARQIERQLRLLMQRMEDVLGAG